MTNLIQLPPECFDIKYSYPVYELSRRLIPASFRYRTVYEFTGAQGPFENEDHYYFGLGAEKPAALRPVQERALVYQIRGHEGVEIEILECEAYAFDAARQRRFEGKAWKGDLALPEDIVYILDQLPSTHIVPNILLLNRPNWADGWVTEFRTVLQRQKEDELAKATGGPVVREPPPKFESACAQMIDGSLVFFKARNSFLFRCNFMHEWFHYLHKPNSAYSTPPRYPVEWSFFCDAVALEWRRWMPKNSSYMLRCINEHGAILGQDLLHWQGKYALEVMDNAPLRAYFLLQMLKKELLNSPNVICADSLLGRVRRSEETVVRASKQMFKKLQGRKGRNYKALLQEGFTDGQIRAMVTRIKHHLKLAEHSGFNAQPQFDSAENRFRVRYDLRRAA